VSLLIYFLGLWPKPRLLITKRKYHHKTTQN